MPGAGKVAAPHQSYKDVPGGEILTQFARGEVRDGLSTEPICLGDPSTMER